MTLFHNVVMIVHNHDNVIVMVQYVIMIVNITCTLYVNVIDMVLQCVLMIYDTLGADPISFLMEFLFL